MTKNNAFTLIELLATIAIIAVLSIMVFVFIPNAINWATKTKNQQTLNILNEALDRYRTLGGLKAAHSLQGVDTVTKINNVITALKNGITIAGTRRSFLSQSTAIDTSTLSVAGSGKTFCFAKLGIDTATQAVASTSLSITPLLYSSIANGPTVYWGALRSDGTYLYALNNTVSPWTITKMDGNFGVLSTISLPTSPAPLGMTFSVTDNDSYKFIVGQGGWATTTHYVYDSTGQYVSSISTFAGSVGIDGSNFIFNGNSGGTFTLARAPIASPSSITHIIANPEITNSHVIENGYVFGVSSTGKLVKRLISTGAIVFTSTDGIYSSNNATTFVTNGKAVLSQEVSGGSIVAILSTSDGSLLAKFKISAGMDQQVTCIGKYVYGMRGGSYKWPTPLP